MRVAYVCTDPGVPVFGSKGGSIHVREVLRALAARGCEVTVIARRLGGDTPRGLAIERVVELSKAPGGEGEARERFLLEANEELVEVLGACGAFDLVYERHALWSYAAMEHARAAGAPALLEVNAPLVEEQRRFRSLSLVVEAEGAADRAFAASSAMLAVSEPLASWLRARAGRPEDVHVVPNGVDSERFSPDRTPESPAPGVVTIGFVGSLRPWHGVDRLVEAFGMVRGEGLPVRLMIVGDGPARAQIESMCAGLGGSAVLTGGVDPERVPGLLTSMDVCVAPYPSLRSFYFSPLKLFEYMASGRAIVASGDGQIGELLRDGETALLVEPGDVESLARALRRVVLDGGLRARLGRAARAKAVAEHQWSGVAGRILSIAFDARKAAV